MSKTYKDCKRLKIKQQIIDRCLELGLKYTRGIVLDYSCHDSLLQDLCYQYWNCVPKKLGKNQKRKADLYKKGENRTKRRKFNKIEE